MQYNLEQLQAELARVLENKASLEEELNSAFNQEHYALVQGSLDANKSMLAILQAQIKVINYIRSSQEASTYSDLIIEKLINTYGRMDDIEDQRCKGHNQEHGEQMDAESELLQAEESKLALELYNISARNNTAAEEKEEVGIVSDLSRTLSVPHGDAGHFERECMLVANNMIILLIRSYNKGELTDVEYAEKHKAVNAKIQFFRQSSVESFESEVKSAVLNLA